MQATLILRWRSAVLLPEKQAQGMQGPFPGMTKGIYFSQRAGAADLEVDKQVPEGAGFRGFVDLAFRVVAGGRKRNAQPVFLLPKPHPEPKRHNSGMFGPQGVP